VDDKITISVVGSGIFALYHHDRLMTEKNNQVSRLTAEVERLKDRLADAVAQATPPAKSVVWVRKMVDSHYKPCNAYGTYIEPAGLGGSLEAWQNVPNIEVRVWPETCDKCGHVIASEGR